MLLLYTIEKEIVLNIFLLFPNLIKCFVVYFTFTMLPIIHLHIRSMYCFSRQAVKVVHNMYENNFKLIYCV